MRAAFFGGICYFLIQYNIHDFQGGDLYFGYRYPHEALAAWTPLLFHSYLQWVPLDRFRMFLFWITVGMAVAWQVVGVLHPFGL